MIKTILVLLKIGLLSHISLALDFDKSKLDDYFKALEVHEKFMGSVAVSRAGEIIYSKSIGYTDVEYNQKADINTIYRIGSISKTFTAVLVFKAVEMNIIDISETIDKYFPTIKNADKITISHLLSHRSGIASFTDSYEYLNWNTQAKTEKELVDIITKSGSVFEPDSKAAYSNSNYVLLTFILEKTFKKSYAELLSEYITKPLLMGRTFLGRKINPKNNECYSYSYSDTWRIVPETDISIPLGAGGIVSTVGDIIKFSSALFSNKIISPESLNKMKTLQDDYGMGLFQIPFYDKISYGHTGGIDGFTAIFSYFPDDNIAYVLLSNGSNYNINNISVAVLSAVFGKPYSVTDFKTFDLSSEELDRYIGVYSSKQIPLKITISKDNKNLFAQATGQSAFPLEATEKDKFQFEQAGIIIEFNPDEKTFILKQGGGQYLFFKE